jgi:gamma-glutamyltranspeptidase
MDTCLQMALNVLDFGLDIQESCAAPLIDSSGSGLLVDDRLPARTRQKLREMGHDVVDATVSFSPRHLPVPRASWSIRTAACDWAEPTRSATASRPDVE